MELFNIDGEKFSGEGYVRKFPGNTIICHLPQQGDSSELFLALLNVYRQFPIFRYSQKFTLLPPSSYHMTVLPVSLDYRRETWPQIARKQDLETCNRLVLQKLKDTEFDLKFPIEVAPKKFELMDQCAIGIIVEPVGDSLKTLLEFRKKVSEVLQFEYDPTYRFHVTLGYLHTPLTADEYEEFQDSLDVFNALLKGVESVVFQKVEYCVFDDMFEFKRACTVT